MANKNIAKTATFAAEIIKKGKYKVFNGTDYETVYLQTSADQVIESDSKKFVSQAEKNTWNSKAEGNHNHDSVYAKIGVSYTKAEANNLLAGKSDIGHTHAATSVIEDSTHRFVTDAEKSRWNNTYTTSQVDAKIGEVNDAIIALEAENATQHSTITKGYQDADKILDGKVSDVQDNLDQAIEDLTALINNGGSANDALAARVATIESTTIPGVKKSVTDLDAKLSGQITTLSEEKADKTQVTADIAAAKTALQNNINLKANTADVNASLALKANAADVYTKSQVDSALSVKADTDTVNNALSLKADKSTMTTELNKKANITDVNNSLALKADATALETGLAAKAEKVHKHTTSDITGLGTAATKNTGVAAGNIPVLNSNGKLETSVLPSIAINEVFTAASTSAAMSLDMQVGDILVLETAVREAVEKLQEQGEAVTYKISNTKSVEKLSDEYVTYIASGRMTYLCVDASATTFENKFKPLQSSGDTISAAEVQAALNLKVNVSDFNTYKGQVTNNLALKADKATTYTKTEVDTSLSNKVDKVSGKGLSTNDFTTALKTKLEGIAEGANKYVHPTGDGNLHVPATGTTNNGKVLMAGSSAGALSWTALTTNNITDNANKRFVTDAQIAAWNGKANANHSHDQYRLISDSYSQTQTRTEIKKIGTIVSATKPSASAQVAGAVWIEEI